jgi:hypothetical protein
VIVEARIDGLPDPAGTTDVYAADPTTLLQLSTVTAQLAVLSAEARQ